MTNHKQKPLTEDAIDTLEKIAGTFPSARRAHAKGQVYDAKFVPNGNAVPYTTAPHLQKEEVSATVRFSNSSTNPTAADILSPVKGMAVKFNLPDGGHNDLIGVSIPLFPAESPEDFIEMIKILTDDKTDKRMALKNLLTRYPDSKEALLKVKELKSYPPASFSELSYYPLHAFYFVNKEGMKQPVRYEWHPMFDKHTLTSREAKETSHDYLMEELDDRLTRGPISFDLIIQLGEEGDPIDDPSKSWPEARTKISIGRLSVISKQTGSPESLLFDPTVVSSGIELSGDPFLKFRHEAYAVSLDRRTNG